MRGKGWGHLQERGRWSRFLLSNCCGWVVVVSASGNHLRMGPLGKQSWMCR